MTSWHTLMERYDIVDEALRWVTSDVHKRYAEQLFDDDSTLPVNEMSIELLWLRVLDEQWNLIEFCRKRKLDEYCIDATTIKLIRNYKRQVQAVAVPANVVRIPGIDEDVLKAQDAFSYARNAANPIVVLLLVNFDENHWCGVIIDCQERIIILFNPLRCQDRINEVSRLVQSKIEPLLPVKKYRYKTYGAFTQSDSYNCGVGILVFFEAFLSGKNICIDNVRDAMQFFRYRYLSKNLRAISEC
ncbi:hypothetical protein DVH05_001491 [Phytophthora capsici]|nr:hypothetical protein DVH05_001491 [Phytophthora capsici]